MIGIYPAFMTHKSVRFDITVKFLIMHTVCPLPKSMHYGSYALSGGVLAGWGRFVPSLIPCSVRRMHCEAMHYEKSMGLHRNPTVLL